MIPGESIWEFWGGPLIQDKLCCQTQAVRLGRDELEPLRIMFELAAGAGQVRLGSCLPHLL